MPDAASPRAPGTLASHYAPTAPVVLLDAATLHERLRSLCDMRAGPGAVVGVYSRIVPDAGLGWVHRAMPTDPAAAAHELFGVLRDFDAAGVSAIWVERPPAGPGWEGVRDRLRRAAA
jgi:L-threonylcarbamoyladenylate synthase